MEELATVELQGPIDGRPGPRTGNRGSGSALRISPALNVGVLRASPRNSGLVPCDVEKGTVVARGAQPAEDSAQAELAPIERVGTRSERRLSLSPIPAPARARTRRRALWIRRSAGGRDLPTRPRHRGSHRRCARRQSIPLCTSSLPVPRGRARWRGRGRPGPSGGGVQRWRRTRSAVAPDSTPCPVGRNAALASMCG